MFIIIKYVIININNIYKTIIYIIGLYLFRIYICLISIYNLLSYDNSYIIILDYKVYININSVSYIMYHINSDV